MENTYRIKLIMLARHLDYMPEDRYLIPSSIIMGYKGQDGTSHETSYPEYSSAIPMHEIFPDEWAKNNNDMIVLKIKPDCPSFASFMLYFNLDFSQFMHCFVSYFQDLQKYGGIIIFHENVTPHMIARNIHGLIDRM